MNTDEKDYQPITVKNRDIPLLAAVTCIMQDVCMLEEQRAWTKDRMTNISVHLTGMPGGGGATHGLEDVFSRLAEVEEEHKEGCRQYYRQLKAAEDILNGIRSDSMRTFVKMKYVFDIPDTEIRERLNMTRRGFEKARQAVEDAPNMAAVRWREKFILASTGEEKFSAKNVLT